MVGVSGKIGERVALATASKRSLPALICWIVRPESNAKSTWSLSRAVTNCAAPLYAHVGGLKFRRAQHLFGVYVQRAAAAHGSIIELAGIGSGVGNQVGYAAYRQGRAPPPTRPGGAPPGGS